MLNITKTVFAVIVTLVVIVMVADISVVIAIVSTVSPTREKPVFCLCVENAKASF